MIDRRGTALQFALSCYIRVRAVVDGVSANGVGWEVRSCRPAFLFADVMGGDVHHRPEISPFGRRVTTVHGSIPPGEAIDGRSGSDRSDGVFIAGRTL